MAIPLFSGPSAFPRMDVADIPIESLSQTINTALKVAEATPSPVASIAQGITGGIDTYTKLEQRQAQTDLIRAQTEAAQAKAAGQGLSPQQARQRLKLQEELQLRQQQEAFTDILQNGTPQQLAGAVVSGQYADILSKNSKLEDAAVRKVALSGEVDVPRFEELYLNNKNTGIEQRENVKNRLQLEEKYADYTRRLPEITEVDEYLESNPKETRPGVIKNLDFKPRNQFQVTPDGVVTPIDENSIGSLTGSTDGYIAVDKRSGKVVNPDVNKDFKKYILDLRSTSRGIDGNYHVSNNERFLGQVKEVKKIQDAASQGRQQRNSAINQKIALGQLTPEQAQRVQKQIQEKPVSFGSYKNDIGTLSFVDAQGNLDLNQGQILPTLILKGIDAPITVQKELEPAMENILSIKQQQYNNPQRSSGEVRDDLEQFGASKREILETTLGGRFDEMSKAGNTPYTEKDVKAHNRDVEATIRNLTSLSRTGVPNLNGLVKVSTPKELYVLKNYGSKSTRFDSFLQELDINIRRRAQARLKQAQVGSAALNTSKLYVK